ncbi:CPBP family intramembrane glutamic endopeptidase [Tsukamurella pulmonis]|uniref:CPBP family intramembrane glutamic endopeptidase n=1 Tax=Tsukamurella pulmonis TaxID=47312 RepID=UPI001058E82D|nr:CPBP family intramembrane glutamic endopeptidase [Tsukamurella pulmonis]
MSAPVHQPRLPLTPTGIAIRVVVAVGTLFGANVIGTAVLALSAAVLDGERLYRTNLGLALAVASNAVVCATVVGVVWLWCRHIERRPLRSTGWVFTRSSPAWLLIGTAACAALVAAVSLALPAQEAAVGEGSAASAGFTVIAVVSQAFLMQGAPEELLFRGWLLTSMRERPLVAIVVTTLGFTAIHLVSSGGQQTVGDHLAYLALPFGMALLAVGVLLWTRSLWGAVGVHGGFHVGVAIAGQRFSDDALSWFGVGGTLAVAGLVLTASALRAGRRLDPCR